MPNFPCKIINIHILMCLLVTGCRVQHPSLPLISPALRKQPTPLSEEVVSASTLTQETTLTMSSQTVVPTPLSPHCTGKPGMVQQTCISPATGLHYLAYLPPQSLDTPSTKLPLLVCLQGYNHSCSDLDLLLVGGFPAEIEKGRSPPMMVISPQSPAGDNWQFPALSEKVSRLADELVAVYHLYPQRVYLTGFSMGGDGVWTVG